MKSLKYLNKYLYKYKFRLLFGFIFIILSNLFAVYPAQLIREALDLVEAKLNNTTIIDSSFLSEFIEGMSLTKIVLLYGAIVFLAAIIRGAFTFFMRQTIIIMSRLAEYDLKNEVFNHYQDLDTSFYKANNTGDIMNRISEDVTKVRMYLGPGIMYSLNLIVLFIIVRKLRR